MLVKDFSRFILPEVIGCPDPLLDQAIVQTAFHFCDQSGAWDEIQEPIALEAGVSQYELEAPTDAIALRIRDAFLDGQRLQSGQFAFAVNRQFDSADAHGILTIRPTPSQAGSLQLRVIYAPAMSARRLPDVLLARYEQAISAGTKARLMLMNGVTWANPNLGSFYSKSYEESLADARAESVFDRAGGSLYVAPRRFA